MSEPSEQAAKILGPLSGTATVWALDLGLRLGLFEYLADRATGATAGEVAEDLLLDPQYTHVVLRAATFLVSEFPFPEREQDCRSTPDRLMCGSSSSRPTSAASCFRRPASSASCSVRDFATSG